MSRLLMQIRQARRRPTAVRPLHHLHTLFICCSTVEENLNDEIAGLFPRRKESTL